MPFTGIMRAWQDLGCGFPAVHYISRAIEILRERDTSLVRVYNRLMEERTSPYNQLFVDTDGIKEASPLDAG
jgi:hypothetical protein